MTPAGRILVSLMEHAGTGRPLAELLCADAVRRLPVCGVAIGLATDGGALEPYAASDASVRALEGLQLTLGEGPGIEANAAGHLVQQSDLARTAPASWPGYGPAILEAGVRAVTCFPLRIGGIRLGVMDFYRDEPGVLDDASLAEALHYVEAAVQVLLHLQGVASDRYVGGLPPAAFEDTFNCQPEVHQATGMVSAQAGVRLADALLLLRARAYAESRSLPEVAHDVVARRIGFRPT